MTEVNWDTDRLIQSAAEGDAAARNALLLRHRERLVKMVAMRMDKRLQARFDPSDVVQEALITAEARLSEYLRGQPIAFYPWLRKITWEHLLKLHEKNMQAQKRSVEREVQPRVGLNDASADELVNRLVGNMTSPSNRMVRKERERRVRAALKLLKPRDREIIELLYLEQLKPVEVADALEITPSVVWSRHLRAIRRLTSMLEDE